METTLKNAKLFIEKRANMPVLSTVAIENTRATATDLESFIQLSCNHSLKPGCYKVDNLALIGHVPPFCELDDYPTLAMFNAVKTGHSLTLYELQDICKQHLYTMSTDLSRNSINALYFDDSHIVSTNGHFLQITRSPLPNITALLPHSFCLAVSKLKVRPDCLLDVSLSPTAIRFDSDTISLGTKLVDAQYPDYEQVIPDLSTYVMTESLPDNTKQLLSKLKPSKPLDYQHPTTTISWDADGNCNYNTKVNSSWVPVPIPQLNGKAVNYCLLPYFLVQAVAALGQGITIQTKDRYAACVITNPNGDQVILMPLRMQ